MNSIIWKGVSSTAIKGLIINELPPISKPELRVMETVVDGRNGSIIEDLGYNPYDKPLAISLHGNFDINEVIKYFTGEGEVVFSNEPDKVYRARIYAQIDYNRLLRYRQATIIFRTQPFKYAFNEEISTTTATASGTSIVVNDSENANLKGFKIFGKSTQDGTPTPSVPIDIISVGDDGNITLNISGGDTEQQVTFTTPLRAVPVTDESLATYTDAEGKMWCADEIDLERGVYVQRIKKFELATANMNNAEDYPGWTDQSELTECFPVGTNKKISVLSNVGRSVSVNVITINRIIFLPKEVYGLTESEWGANYPNLVCTFLFPLITPVETPLTEEQIAICKNLKANNPTTTISNDENAYMSIEYLRLFEVENKGLETSRPRITIKGTGTVELSVNGVGIFSYTFPEGENQVVIDSETEDAYFGDVLKNRNMNGEFPILQPGTNKIEWTGDVESIEIEPRSRWL